MALYSLGLDIGRKNDRTAWAVVRRTRVSGVLPSGDDYDVVYCSARRGIGSTDIVDRTLEILTYLDGDLAGADRLSVTMDMSGLGWGVADALYEALRATHFRHNPPPRLWAATITDGNKINPDPDKTHLVNIGRPVLTEGTAQALVSGRLRMTDEEGAALPILGDGVELLREEIAALNIKTTATRSRIDHPGGKHDDTWMALCLAYTRAVSAPAPPPGGRRGEDAQRAPSQPSEKPRPARRRSGWETQVLPPHPERARITRSTILSPDRRGR